MLRWFKWKPHVHKYEEEWLSTRVTSDQIISFFRCECGARYAQRFYYQGTHEGEIVIENLVQPCDSA